MDAMDASVDYNMLYPPFHNENILSVWLNQLYLLHMVWPHNNSVWPLQGKFSYLGSV